MAIGVLLKTWLLIAKVRLNCHGNTFNHHPLSHYWSKQLTQTLTGRCNLKDLAAQRSYSNMDKEIDSKDNSTDAIAEDPPPSIRSLLGQFCGYTTAHGLGRLSESKNIISRLTWSLFCVGASTMFVLQVYNLFLIYLSRPVSTVVKVEHESVSIYVYQFKQACILTELDFSYVPSISNLFMKEYSFAPAVQNRGTKQSVKENSWRCYKI